MGEVQSLLLVLALLYASECLVWVRRGVLAFTSWWGRFCRLSVPGSLAGNQRGGLFLANLVPGQGKVFLCGPPCLSLSLSPEACYAYSSIGLDPAGRPSRSGVCLSWDDIRSVDVDGRHVRLNRLPPIPCSSTVTAHETAAWIREVSRASASGRADLITRWVTRSLDLGALRTRLEAGRGATRRLRHLARGLFVYLFGLLPPLLARYGFGLVALGLALGLVTQTVTIAFLFRRAHRSLFPQDTEERFKHFLIMLLAPPAAIRAPDLLDHHLVETFHPLAVARALGTPETFRSFARRVLVDLRWPMLPICPTRDPRSGEAERWFRHEHARLAEEFVRDQGLDPAELLAPPRPAEPGNRSYCPRCGVQFLKLEGTCLDCGGRALERFTGPPQGGSAPRNGGVETPN